ncbi:MAG: hypothetical protein LAE24_01450 [Candidatus Contendobacter sp.]|jgi:hypothetical protein|nr:hypothetical protein [Candidatus Contendobacter sp.]
MSTWQLTGGIFLIVATLAGVLLVRYVRQWKEGSGEPLETIQRAVAEKVAAEKAVLDKVIAEKVAVARAAAERMAVKRAAMEKSVAERAIAEKAAVEQAITEWAAAEQAEAERVQVRRATEERREAEEREGRLRAVEDAIAEWVEVEREGSRLAVVSPLTPGKPAPSDKPTYTRTEAIHQQVRSMDEGVEKEIQELDYVKNRIQAGVDFLPVEFQHTIDDWKAGNVMRRSTLDDIKLKFRYKAYSIEDGYELLYLYNEWLSQQRQKLRVFMRLLGTQVEKSDSIQAAIEQAEQIEREKYLEMDVDVIFTLRDIRTIVEKLFGMETLIKELEEVCRKRSNQIIAPSWEARGLAR